MKKITTYFILLFMFATLISCAQPRKKAMVSKSAAELSTYSKATFASGCFWCVEGVFESVTGVAEVISGYSGGVEPNPTYEQVSAHTTLHAEAVQVYYDAAVVSYATLLKVYFASQDPTQVNGQGPDHGESYRSIIFYTSPDEKNAAQKYITEIQKKYTQPIAAELLPLVKFWQAEGYHQNYIQKKPNVPYVRGESIPRIKRFQKQYPELIKPDRKL